MVQLLLHAHGQVDEGEHVVLDHDGETQEDRVEDQRVDTQLQIQLPVVHMNPPHLQRGKHTSYIVPLQRGTQYILYIVPLQRGTQLYILPLDT